MLGTDLLVTTLPGSLADALPIGLVFLDEEGRIRALNDAAADLLAQADEWPDSQLGRNFFDLLACQDAAHWSRLYDELLAGKRTDLEVPTPVAGERKLRRVGIHVRALDQPPDRRGGLALLEDRSALQAERARRRQSERLAVLGETVAGVAHELNNPLASIRTLAEQLTRETRTADHRKLLELVAEEAARAASIVRRQLDLVRDTKGDDAGPLDLNALVQRVVTLRRYEIENHEIELRLDLDPSISIASGDGREILQGLLNLVVNAEEALASRSPPEGRRIILRTRETSEGVVCAVIDNGPGIPRNVLERMFDPFFTTKSSGSGLGLALTRSLVTDHGGRVWVESQEGNGTAFFLRLPRRVGPLPEQAEDRDAGRGPDVQDTSEIDGRDPEGPSRRLRIVVADDEPVLRMAIQRVLEGCGHSVVGFGDAGAALAFLEEAHDVDVVFVDAHMPGDGLALVENLERAPSTRGRVILMSGDLRGLAAYREWSARDRFLQKPFRFRTLMELVAKASGPRADPLERAS